MDMWKSLRRGMVLMVNFMVKFVFEVSRDVGFFYPGYSIGLEDH